MVNGILWPVSDEFEISQKFGHPPNVHPWEPTQYLRVDKEDAIKCRGNYFYKGFRYTNVHPGVDILCPFGTKIKAAADGKVVAAGVYSLTDEKYLMIRFHKDDTTQTVAFYTHLNRVLVPIGERVTRGDVVALSGNSGWSTGPHLHFEVRTGPSEEDAWRSTDSRDWYRWNPERLRVGGDMAYKDFIK